MSFNNLRQKFRDQFGSYERLPGDDTDSDMSDSSDQEIHFDAALQVLSMAGSMRLAQPIAIPPLPPFCYELQPKINSVLAVTILLRINAMYDAKVVVIHNFVSIFLSRKNLPPSSTYVSVFIRVRTAPTREGLLTPLKRMRVRELKDLK